MYDDVQGHHPGPVASPDPVYPLSYARPPLPTDTTSGPAAHLICQSRQLLDAGPLKVMS